MTGQDIAATAAKFIGQREPTGDDYFIKYYNRIAGASFSMTTAWCAIFVTVCARLSGVSADVIPTYASCTLGKRWYESRGRYEKGAYYGGDYQPKVGDVIFYSSGYTQDKSTHTGLVVSSTEQCAKVIEGNKSDAVGYRVIHLNNRYIIGYGRVAEFLDEHGEAPEPAEVLSTVEQFQTWLNSTYSAGLEINGKYGRLTRAAAIRAYQTECNRRFKAGLEVDGVFGPASKKYGNRALVKVGTRGNFVYIVEGVLGALGLYPGELDGVAGQVLESGIKNYQRAHGLTPDGENGRNTYAAEFML